MFLTVGCSCFVFDCRLFFGLVSGRNGSVVLWVVTYDRFHCDDIIDQNYNNNNKGVLYTCSADHCRRAHGRPHPRLVSLYLHSLVYTQVITPASTGFSSDLPQSNSRAGRENMAGLLFWKNKYFEAGFEGVQRVSF